MDNNFNMPPILTILPCFCTFMGLSIKKCKDSIHLEPMPIKSIRLILGLRALRMAMEDFQLLIKTKMMINTS